MAEYGPPPAKRMRYNLRSSARLKSNVTANEPNEKNGTKANEAIASNQPVTTGPHRSAYKLRSRGKINENGIESVELPRKRKKPSLLALNPDCLLKLFEYMNLSTLCSMAETCTTFYNYAKYHFRLKHKHFDFASMFDGDLLDMDKATRLLRIFGDQIHTLKISRDLFTDDDSISTGLLQSIGANCRQIVKVLTLDGIDFLPGIMMVDNLSTLFNSIEMLTLDQCSMYDVDWCDMNNLKVLKLTEVEGFDAHFWQVNFDKLEAVEFNHLDIDAQHLTEFILSVPTIKRLSIVKCSEITTAIFGVIKHLENLEEFEFQLNRPNRSEEFHRRDLMLLTSTKKLKVLKLNCNKKDVRQLIDGFYEKKIAIEHLELAQGLVDVATVEAIAKLKTIKVLKFNDMIEFADYLMLPIANGLNQLEELHIKTAANISQFRVKEFVRTANRLTCLKIDANNFGLNTVTYHAILNAVRNRADKNHLAITIYGDGKQPTVPDAVSNGPNEKWLKVTTFDRRSNHLFPSFVWTTDEIDADDEEFDDEEFLELDIAELIFDADRFDGFDDEDDVMEVPE